MDTVEPIYARAAEFLQAVREERPKRAKEVLDAYPAVARHSIHTAAAVGDADAVAAFIAADPASATRATVPDGTEPIVYAVLTDLKRLLAVDEATQVATVRALLDAGASANASVPLDGNDARIPVLYFPSNANSVAVARLLLERGANPTDSESVFHAAKHNHRDVLEVLLAFGAELSRPHPQYGNTPLYFLAGHREPNPLSAQTTLGMQWLLEHGADPNVPSNAQPKPDGTPGPAELPLHRIAASGRGEFVARMLMEHGAVVDAPRADGRTAYAMAVRAGNTSTARYLASVGADTSRVTPVDRLLGACTVGDESTARAVLATHPTIMSALTAEDQQPMATAVGDNAEDAVRLMLSLGWPMTGESEWGGTPLHWAAWNGRVSIVRLLLEHGAPVNVRDSQYGSSPIAWAAHGSTNSDHGVDADYVAIVNLLLDVGATRAESYNKWNESPESMAHPAVVQLFKSRGFAV